MNNLLVDPENALQDFVATELPKLEKVKLMNRVDTKYVFPITTLPGIIDRMKGSYNVLEIERKRIFKYNTIYLDTEDFLFFNHHIHGKLNRIKVRFRQYEQTGESFLEIKKKTNTGRTFKWRTKSIMPENDAIRKSDIEFVRPYVNAEIMSLKPVLLTEFFRVTFMGRDFKERVTLDMDLTFTGQNGKKEYLPFAAVMEIKTERHSISNSSLAGVLKSYHVYPSSFSKYCMGIAYVMNVPGKNVLKPQLLFLNKLKNEYNERFYA